MDRITGGTVNFDVQYNEFVLKQEPWEMVSAFLQIDW
jgi:hypothetical protein